MNKALLLFVAAAVLIAGCTLDRPLADDAGRFSLDTVQKADISESYGEALFDTISGGLSQKRVIGYIDRAT